MTTLSSSLQSILDNRLRYLPEITGKAITSIDWSTKLITIGKKYGLHIDEMEEFQTVVLKSMIGLIPPEQFETELISALAVSPTDTEKIIHEINDQIFEPIHNFIMNQGAVVDPLKQAGIIIEPVQEGSSSKELPISNQNISHEPTLEIPASPETVPLKPEVSGDFSSFFKS